METFSASLALCAGIAPVTCEFPSQRPVMGGLDVLLDLCLNKRLSKQSWGWWFETTSHQLWRHCKKNAQIVESYILKDECPFILNLQYHGYWCSSAQDIVLGISSFESVCPEYNARSALQGLRQLWNWELLGLSFFHTNTSTNTNITFSLVLMHM